MLNSQKSNKKGFTIIEVVLVLAIAGLIFLMIFMALPALQRAQRDNGRKRSVGLVVAAINSWKANNKGRSIESAVDRSKVKTRDDPDLVDEKNKKLKWISAVDDGILDNYLSLENNKNKDGKSHLSSEIQSVGLIQTPHKDDKLLLKQVNSKKISRAYSIIAVVPGVTCPTDGVKNNGSFNYLEFANSTERRIAVYTFLENGGFYCENA